MFAKIEAFFYGKIAGRVIARFAVTGAAWLVGQAAAKGVRMDPNEVSSALIAAANGLYTYFSEWRAKRAAAAAPAAK